MNPAMESLIFAMHANKGVYALLLGSGISRAAGILSGWDVMMDLIGKIRAIRKARKNSPELSNLDWYHENFGKEPNYSDILAHLGASQSDRSAILKPYFERQGDDPEDTKCPTSAHNAIARLMVSRNIKVVITTNFDRLLEQACSNHGVHPVVISSPSAISGMLPLAHQKHLILKIHGDYQSPETLNTLSEISQYDENIEDIIKTVFQDFGLIICGWSGEWDVALSNIIDSSVNRRFSMYWATYKGLLNDNASDLVKRRNAITIPIDGADEFFARIADSIDALDNYSRPNRPSLDVLAALTKKHLSSDTTNISILELITEEEQDFYTNISTLSIPYSIPGDTQDDIIPSLMNEYFKYEGITSRLAILAFLMGKHCNDHLFEIMAPVIQRMYADISPASGVTCYVDMRRLPPYIMTYAFGMGLLLTNRYSCFSKLMTLQVAYQDVRVNNNFELPIAMNAHEKITHIFQSIRPSTFLLERLQELISQYFPNKKSFRETFDWFEYLLCIFRCYHGIY